MDINTFLFHFKGFILDSYIQVPTVSTDEGIHFFYPHPARAKNCLFLGEQRQWNRLLTDNAFIDGCTYLVCTGSARYTPLGVDFRENINVIFISINTHETLQKINHIFLSTENKGQDEGELALIEFFKMVSTQNIQDHETMTVWLEKFPFSLKTYFSVIVVRSMEQPKETSSVSDIREKLCAFFKENNLFFYNNEWIILYSQEEKASDSVDISYADFNSLLSKHQLYAGISYVGLIPENIYTLYLTATASISLGLKAGLPSTYKRIFFFSQYHTLYLIHLCARQFDHKHNGASLYYMAHPDIVRIYTYDKEHNGDLLDILYAFLTNDSNLTKTAQHSYMHRNTIYNKLLKIEGIIGYPLAQVKDNAVFILSYMVIRYYRDYQNNDID